MVLIQPDPIGEPPERSQLERQIADLQRQHAVHVAIGATRAYLPFEVTSYEASLAELAGLEQQLVDLPEKLAAKAARHVRPYALVLRIGSRVEIWTCNDCGTGVVRLLAAGGEPLAGADGRDLHDLYCPAPHHQP